MLQRKIPFILLFILSLLQIQCGSQQDNETKFKNSDSSDIINGESAYSLRDPNHPVLTSTVAVILTNKTTQKESICSGVVIHETLVITAAHCLLGSTPNRVIFGKELYSHDHTSLLVKRFQGHPDFNGAAQKNANPLFDIAWIELAQKIPEKFHPVAILRDPTTLFPEESVIISGFGAIGEIGPRAHILGRLRFAQSQVSAVDTYKIDKFNSLYGENSFANFMVVLSQQNPPRAACRGDSGGPAYIYRDGNWMLAAITQGAHSLLTPDPQNPKYPSPCENGAALYTTVGNYLPWIAETSGVTL